MAFTKATFDYLDSGGLINWQLTAKNTAFTAVSGEGYLVDTTSAAVTVTLPASPNAGDEIIIVDYASNAGTNNITLDPGVLNLRGATDDLVLSTNNQTARLLYSGATKGWLVTTEAGAGTAAAGPDLTVNYLVVAGGGGGGKDRGGGGGAGGYRTSYGITGGGGSGEAALPLIKDTNYTVTIGAGGNPAPYNVTPTLGGNSVFHTITSTGGGGGGSSTTQGADGGSGGGAPNAGTQLGGSPVTPTQGYKGGDSTGATNAACGGGGGAGGAGANATSNAGAGGVGLSSNITGIPVFRGGGGGGGASDGAVAAGGNGGGGAGCSNNSSCTATSGTPNTGGGGGGNGGGGGGSGGYGGSGIVILRYPDAYTITETTSAQLTFTTATVGSDKVTTFTGGDGTIEFTA